MDTPPDSQRKAWARLSTLTSFVSRICFFKARCSDSDSVNGFIVIPPAFDFTRVRLGGVKKILSTYLGVSRINYILHLLRSAARVMPLLFSLYRVNKMSLLINVSAHS